MGPWSEKKQYERARSVVRLLNQPDLSDWAENYWSNVVKNLSRSEDQYNERVKQTYQNMIQWRNPFDE